MARLVRRMWSLVVVVASHAHKAALPYWACRLAAASYSWEDLSSLFPVAVQAYFSRG